MGKPSKDDIDKEEQVTRIPSRSDNDFSAAVIDEKKPFDFSFSQREVPVAVVEQRVSNLAQGALCLVLLTGPFLHILGLVPRGVLAGLL